VEPEPVMELEVTYMMGGQSNEGDDTLSSMERYEASSGQWSAVADMGSARRFFGICLVAEELYVTGGCDEDYMSMDSMEKYSPSSDTWSSVSFMPDARSSHAAVAVGRACMCWADFSKMMRIVTQ
jgi:hypothetical protein